MPQNRYDDPEFFDRYAAMPRSVHGLASAHEWPTLRAFLPELTGKRVLDLGCGFGWHCRFARERGAASVVGVDLSEKMLARARELTDDPAIVYVRAAIEEIAFPDASFDVALSSLALHYVADFGRACETIFRTLVPGGVFALSVEHPVFTARPEQDWHLALDGARLHWPLDDYQQEGIRHTSWLAENVIKYHRTVSTYINALLDAGFRLDRIAEPAPTEAALDADPALRDELRRPIFLLLRATRP